MDVREPSGEDWHSQLDTSIAWLRRRADPVVDLELARRLAHADGSVIEALRSRVHDTALVRAAAADQRSAASWGAADAPRKRILSTLRMTQVLVAVGAEEHPAVAGAVDFLAAHALTADGTFTIDGTRRGVLSCYVGIAMACQEAVGRVDLAERQLEWIRAHQEVRVGGDELRDDRPCAPDEVMRSRYGGCMADTTCLLGLVKVGQAIRAHVDRGGGTERDRSVLEAVREVFIRRRLHLTSTGTNVPLGVPAHRAEEWLDPTFPLDHRTDLVEVLDLVGRTGGPDPRLRPAIDQLMARRLEDGSWPLRRALWPGDLRIRTRRDRRRGDPMATLRTTLALHAATRGVG